MSVTELNALMSLGIRTHAAAARHMHTVADIDSVKKRRKENLAVKKPPLMKCSGCKLSRSSSYCFITGLE